MHILSRDLIHRLNGWLACKDIKIPELYLVGGTVRDLILNCLPKDTDLVCRGAAEFARSLSKCKKAALVSMEKKPEEPCYRVVDKGDTDNFLDIAEMRGETICDDLSQRDFTINAIAVEVNRDGSLGKTIDPLNGTEDIKRKVIRLAGSNSLVSDPLRVLRVIRFAASLDFTVERSAWEEMKKRVSLLSNISAERIMTEVMFILQSPKGSHFFRQMDTLGILDIILPEIRPMKGCSQNGFHHKDVWEHSLLVMENCEKVLNNLPEYFGDVSYKVEDNINNLKRRELLKLAALLHDIGKPGTRGVNPDTERITFYRHDNEGAKILGAVAERLRMSNQEREFLVLLAAEHLHVLNLVFGEVKTSTKMRWFRKMGDDSIPATILGMADVMSSLGPDSGEDYRTGFVNGAKQIVRDYYQDIKAVIESPCLITGNDLISLGQKPGPGIGRILNQIRTAQDTGKIRSREEALEMAKRLFAASG